MSLSANQFVLVRIVKSMAEDAPILTRIALEAKRHWGYPEKWIENWRPLLEVSRAFIATTETHSAIMDDETVGFYGLCTEERKPRLEHLWVRPKAIGHGVGRALFQHAIERARGSKCQWFEIESDPNAAGFYRRMGARQVRTNITEIEGMRREVPVFVYEIA